MVTAGSGACSEPKLSVQRPGLTGFNLISWTRSALAGSRPWKRAIDEIHDLGVSRVTFVPFALYDRRMTQVVDESRYGLVCGPKTAVLAEAVRHARRKGMDVNIKPMIEIDNPDGEGEIWRGSIKLDDESLVPFFNSYREFVLDACELARTEGASRFYVGSELGGITSNYKSHGHWEELISACRSRLGASKCQLSYAANFDEYAQIAFWQLLDEIAVDAYFPLASRSSAAGIGRPSEREIRKRVDRFMGQLRMFAESRRKPLYIAEWGVTPFDLTTVDPSDESPSATPDAIEAINAYNALLASMSTQGAWLTGVDFWHWQVSVEDQSNYAIRPRDAVSRLIRRSLQV
jgi:hypothetical protein